MKRNYLLVFLMMIAWPMMTLVLMVRMGLINSTIFTLGLVIYAFLYHPYISAKRLVKLGVIESKDLWKSFIPFWNMKYFDLLYTRN
ncbi:hypothetical protein CLV98_106165 [Dyadobacter jejuensis]|uniref:Uncharacterized protein n=1 Tax=Dyadobacter jejuensis TaxID=1082580 RepID=A0A316AIX7_9BACT|nr:hypothetical protein [Dyadobacter jejuensis]PWJ57693.1 hypothetical protein CLV98_106165 [Dyadobacter jejuensis]